MRLVAPFGFYGSGNTGDEATLQGFARLVREHRPRATAWVASQDPAHTARAEPSLSYYRDGWGAWRGRWARRRAGAIVFPGGTPIMDSLGSWPLDVVAVHVAAARERGRPVAFMGTGTETLCRPESRALVAERLAPHVHVWSVRSSRDRDRLVEWGVPPDRVIVAADMAWLIAPVTAVAGRALLRQAGVSDEEPLVGVNLNAERAMLDREPALFEIVANALDERLEAEGGRVVFLCSEVREGDRYDLAASRRVVAAMRRADRTVILPNQYHTPQDLMSIIACCHTVVSSRYHVCLFSALQSVPFVALQRSDKVSDLCTDMHWPHGILPGQLRSDPLAGHLRTVREERPRLVDLLRTATASCTESSAGNRAVLDQLEDLLKREK
jgi:polysaccharide pyruvyl transferase WcaK-like protein